MGNCVAKTLRFCVCVWKATKSTENFTPEFHAKFHDTLGREKRRNVSLPHFCRVAALRVLVIISAISLLFSRKSSPVLVVTGAAPRHFSISSGEKSVSQFIIHLKSFCNFVALSETQRTLPYQNYHSPHIRSILLLPQSSTICSVFLFFSLGKRAFRVLCVVFCTRRSKFFFRAEFAIRTMFSTGGPLGNAGNSRESAEMQFFAN